MPGKFGQNPIVAGKDGGDKPHEGRPARVIPFGKYLLLERIAVGGMAEVFTAKSFGIEGFEKIIAIKRILPTMAEDEDFISMFIDEAKIAGHLTHANIVPIYELGKIGDSHYIAMEYVWGKDLLQIINRFRRLRQYTPPIMAAWVASKVCEGLEYAHRKRDRGGKPLHIIHRDVSPQNCLVSYDGQIKMIDFGIAKAASRTTKTHAGVLKGKFGYMSPEQVRGETMDHRSDIFALGTCLHEMVTCQRLFSGESDFATLEKVRNADVPPPSTKVPDFPEELETLIMKALSRHARDRFQSAGELREALQRFIASRPPPPFNTSRLGEWMRSAFAPEMDAEKSRLDAFAKVQRPQIAPLSSPFDVGHADTATAPTETPKDEATMITSSPFEGSAEADPAPQPDAADASELADQPTHIFFSSSELEAPPADAVARPTPAQGVDPFEPTLHPESSADLAIAAPAGQSDGATDGVADASAGIEPLQEGPRTKAGIVLGRTAFWSSVALGLALLAGALVLATTALRVRSRGSIEVHALLEGGELTVFVDGVRRGPAPLRVDGLEAGDHQLELRDGNRVVWSRPFALAKGKDLQIVLLEETLRAPRRGESTRSNDRATSQMAQETASAQAQTPTTQRTQEDAPGKGEDAPGKDSPTASGATQASAEPAKDSPGGDDTKSETADAPRRERGILMIQTLPWARVFIDGRDTKLNTPIPRLRVRPGKHRVGLRTPDGRMHTVVVDVAPGKTVRIIKQL